MDETSHGPDSDIEEAAGDFWTISCDDAAQDKVRRHHGLVVCLLYRNLLADSNRSIPGTGTIGYVKRYYLY